MRCVNAMACAVALCCAATGAQATGDPGTPPDQVNQEALKDSGEWRERPFRLPPVDPKTFTPEQKEAAEEMNHFLNLKQMSGPFQFWVSDPRILRGYIPLLKAENDSRHLSPRLTRLLAITIAQQWKSQYEWFIQARLAKRDGVSSEVIEAIRVGKRPDFKKADEALVFDSLTELDKTKAISDPTFKKLQDTFGYDGVAEFINFAGIFTAAGMTIKILDIKAPEPFDADPVPNTSK